MKYHCAATMLLMTIVFYACNPTVKRGNTLSPKQEQSVINRFHKRLADDTNLPFVVKLYPNNNILLPALQSAAVAQYDRYWVMIGGRKEGFHGTSGANPPFPSFMANDSIWVVDLNAAKVYGMSVPKDYYWGLTTSNPEFVQKGEHLYYAGGYGRSDSTAVQSNWTSDYFFTINLPKLIALVTRTAQPTLREVFPFVTRNAFVQITGGEIFVNGDYFYIIGGQNYTGTYFPGRTGVYTNAIRQFRLNPQASQITDTTSYFDPVNLHRRDLNVSPIILNGELNPLIYGGVFTPTGGAFLNNIYITGASLGKLSLNTGTVSYTCNQYSTAKASLNYENTNVIIYLGGISNQWYNPTRGHMEVGDNGIPMPFSNVISYNVLNGLAGTEYVQNPQTGGALLPGFVGSNGNFIPNPEYLLTGYDDVLDLVKVLTAGDSVNIGCLYGGIVSMGPTSGTTPGGNVKTYANRTLYNVFLYNTVSR